jgi:hypothetical protein
VARLVKLSKEGSISTEDRSELEDYVQLEHIMIMAKARARDTRGLASDGTRCHSV